MKLSLCSCEEFSEKLAAKEPVPGGGGVAALVGAMGAALNTMVANYSIGKKNLLEYEGKHRELIEEGIILRKKLLALVDEDAQNFEPLSRAYSMPKNTEEEKAEKERVLQSCLKTACSGPVQMMEYIAEAIELHNELVDISSKMIVSDVGVGVQCLKAALYSAYLNVIVNVNSITDKAYTEKTKQRCEELLEKGSVMADKVFEKTLAILG